MPDLVRPGDALTVGYTASEPARLVLFAVDEGILQVADYDTPDPLEVYLRKKALQVDTHQMVDLILPDYDVLRRASAPGGGDLARLLGANLNPFRRRSEPPVVYWSGIVEADSRQREVAIDIPDYFNGELRVMAVGVASARLGAEAQPVTVRGQIVLTPNLPLAAAPDDVFDVAVGVANYVEGSGEGAELTVSAEALERLSAEDGSERALAVAEGDEGRALFRMRAGASPGAASVTFAGRVNDVSVQRRATLSVRPSTAFQTTVDAGFDADGEVEVVLPRRLHEAFADRRVTASASPLALADGLLAYLETFPHACAEQIVSKAFPQLGLLESQSSGLDRQEYRSLFRDTIALLRPRQNADGGFLFWSTSRESAAFPSVYITHFLTDARELGMPVPDDLYRRSGGYLRRIAGGPESQAPFDLAEARTRAYAIYLLTRRGRVTTNYLNALQESLEVGGGGVARRHRERVHGGEPRAVAQRRAGGRTDRGLSTRRVESSGHRLRHWPRPRRAVRVPAGPALPGAHGGSRRRHRAATRCNRSSRTASTPCRRHTRSWRWGRSTGISKRGASCRHLPSRPRRRTVPSRSTWRRACSPGLPCR